MSQLSASSSKSSRSNLFSLSSNRSQHINQQQNQFQIFRQKLYILFNSNTNNLDDLYFQIQQKTSIKFFQGKLLEFDEILGSLKDVKKNNREMAKLVSVLGLKYDRNNKNNNKNNVNINNNINQVHHNATYNNHHNHNVYQKHSSLQISQCNPTQASQQYYNYRPKPISPIYNPFNQFNQQKNHSSQNYIKKQQNYQILSTHEEQTQRQRQKSYYEQYKQKNKMYEEKIKQMFNQIGLIKNQLNMNKNNKDGGRKVVDEDYNRDIIINVNSERNNNNNNNNNQINNNQNNNFNNNNNNFNNNFNNNQNNINNNTNINPHHQSSNNQTNQPNIFPSSSLSYQPIPLQTLKINISSNTQLITTSIRNKQTVRSLSNNNTSDRIYQSNQKNNKLVQYAKNISNKLEQIAKQTQKDKDKNINYKIQKRQVKFSNQFSNQRKQIIKIKNKDNTNEHQQNQQQCSQCQSQSNISLKHQPQYTKTHQPHQHLIKKSLLEDMKNVQSKVLISDCNLPILKNQATMTDMQFQQPHKYQYTQNNNNNKYNTTRSSYYYQNYNQKNKQRNSFDNDDNTSKQVLMSYLTMQHNRENKKWNHQDHYHIANSNVNSSNSRNNMNDIINQQKQPSVNINLLNNDKHQNNTNALINSASNLQRKKSVHKINPVANNISNNINNSSTNNKNNNVSDINNNSNNKSKNVSSININPNPILPPSNQTTNTSSPTPRPILTNNTNNSLTLLNNNNNNSLTFLNNNSINQLNNNTSMISGQKSSRIRVNIRAADDHSMNNHNSKVSKIYQIQTDSYDVLHQPIIINGYNQNGSERNMINNNSSINGNANQHQHQHNQHHHHNQHNQQKHRVISTVTSTSAGYNMNRIKSQKIINNSNNNMMNNTSLLLYPHQGIQKYVQIPNSTAASIRPQKLTHTKSMRNINQVIKNPQLLYNNHSQYVNNSVVANNNISMASHNNSSIVYNNSSQSSLYKHNNNSNINSNKNIVNPLQPQQIPYNNYSFGNIKPSPQLLNNQPYKNNNTNSTNMPPKLPRNPFEQINNQTHPYSQQYYEQSNNNKGIIIQSKKKQLSRSRTNYFNQSSKVEPFLTLNNSSKLSRESYQSKDSKKLKNRGINITKDKEIK